MSKTMSRGKKVVEKVLPNEVKNLHDEEVIIVNRVRLNSRLVVLEMQTFNGQNQENIQIIRRAIGGMISQEKEKRCVMSGAKMYVRDVKKIFPDVDTMPKNSFVKALMW